MKSFALLALALAGLGLIAALTADRPNAQNQDEPQHPRIELNLDISSSGPVCFYRGVPYSKQSLIKDDLDQTKVCNISPDGIPQWESPQ